MKTWQAIALIVILAMVIRLGVLYITRYNAPHCGTATQIAEAARNMVEGRGYVVDWEYVKMVTNEQVYQSKQIDLEEFPPNNSNYEPYYLLPPGTSAIQALTYWVVGEYRYIYSRVLQAVIDSFGCIFMFLTGRLLWNHRMGIIASIMYALWLPVAYMSTWALHDALMPFFMAVVLYFFVKGVIYQKNILPI